MQILAIKNDKTSYQGKVSPKVISDIEKTMIGYSKEMKIWNGGDYKPHLDIYNYYNDIYESLSCILDNLIDKMKYFAPDCILKCGASKSEIVNKNSTYKLKLVSYDKKLPNHVKYELTNKALNKIHPGLANENFYRFKYDDVPESVFNAEYIDINVSK